MVPYEMMGTRSNRAKVGYGALLLSLSVVAAWFALIQPPSVTEEQACNQVPPDAEGNQRQAPPAQRP